MTKFVNLHVHSEHSFLDGLSKTSDIAQRAKELGQEAVALTDHGEVSGHYAFQKDCLEVGVKPLFGMEGYWVPSWKESREKKTRGYDNSHITFIARDQVGLRNLWTLSTIAYTPEKNFYGKPLADFELMREYSEGLYASDGCMLTEFGRRVNAGDDAGAREIISQLHAIFKERFYMELHTWQIVDPWMSYNFQHYGQQKELGVGFTPNKLLKLNSEMLEINEAKIQIANEFGIPLVVVNDAHYTKPELWENHALALSINTGGNMDSVGEGQTAAWMMDTNEIDYWMGMFGIDSSIVEEACKNTALIAEDCNVEIKGGSYMPKLYPTDEEDNEAFLQSVEEGFKRKVTDKGLDEEVYLKRLAEECKLIVDKGFTGYFNVTKDLVTAAKDGSWATFSGYSQEPIPLLIGPGRGSVGGSLAAYLMDITEMDPIQDDLLFERFLAPSRNPKSPPDIDTDLPQSYRPAFKHFIGARHGHDCVTSIGTFSHLQPRGILQDLCRAMGIPYLDGRAIADIIDEIVDTRTANIEVRWEAILEEKEKELAPWQAKYPTLFTKIGEMQGLIRQSGTHAGGFLISRKPLLGDLPMRSKGGLISTQLDMRACLTGDTVVGDKSLFELYNTPPLVLKSFDENGGELVNNDVLGVLEQGVREVVELQLENGCRLKCTPDHQVYTQRGWVRVDALSNEDEVLTDVG